ncbi:MAG: hypothetical protein QM705_05215 [Ancrocorticia sp.]
MEIIRPVTETDTYGRDRSMLGPGLFPDRMHSPNSRAMLLEINGACVAVGTMRLPRLHDSHYEIRIASLPGEESSAAVRLLTHLMSLRELDRPVMARGLMSSRQLTTMDAAGAHTIQMVPPTSVNTRQRHMLRRDPDVVAASAVDVHALEAALMRMYLWTHDDWARVSDENISLIPTTLGFPAAVDMEASSVVVCEYDGIRALTLVFTDSEVPFLIAETTRRDSYQGERLIEGCVRRSLDILAAQGVHEVEFDGHASDTHFFPNWMKLSPTGQWFRIVELRKVELE